MMRLQCKFLKISIAALFALATPLSAQTPQEDLKRCQDGYPSAKLIASCAAVIDASQHDTETLTMALLHRGRAYLGKRDPDPAIRDLSEVIRLSPTNVEAISLRGAFYTMKGDYDRAFQDCKEAMRLQPRGSEGMVCQGVAYFHKGEKDRAYQDFEKAIRLDSGSAYAFIVRAGYYAKDSKRDLAIQDLTEAIRLRPNNRELIISLVLRGTISPLAQAIQDYTEAIRLRPSDDLYLAQILTQRGIAYFQTDDYARAIQDASDCLPLNPTDGSCYTLRAMAKHAKGDRLGADADLAAAKHLDAEKQLESSSQK